MLDVRFVKENISLIKKDLEKHGERDKILLVY